MKSNLMNYLREYRNKSFKEHPFSEVDALLLSNLSYLKMDGIVPGFLRGAGRSVLRSFFHIRRQSICFPTRFTEKIIGRSLR